MAEREADYKLEVTMRVYGSGDKSDVVEAMLAWNETFDLPGDGEAEIVAVT